MIRKLLIIIGNIRDETHNGRLQWVQRLIDCLLFIAKKAIAPALVAASLAYLFSAIYFVIKGEIDQLLYLPIGAFLYLQFPAVIALILLAIQRATQKQPVWVYVKREFRFLLISLASQAVMYMAMFSIL